MKLQIFFLVTGALCHSWLDCVDLTDSGCNGFVRGYTGHFDDPMTYKILNHADSDPICRPGIQDQPDNYTHKFPRAKAKPGQTNIFQYSENGHVTKDIVPPTNLPNPKSYSIHWTGIPYFGKMDDGSQLLKRGDLGPDTQLGPSRPFDDGVCAEDKTKGRAGPQPCLGNYTIPIDTPPGIYQFVWFWRFDRDPNAGGEEYTSCFDIEVTDPSGKSIFESQYNPYLQPKLNSTYPQPKLNFTSPQPKFNSTSPARPTPIAASNFRQRVPRPRPNSHPTNMPFTVSQDIPKKMQQRPHQRDPSPPNFFPKDSPHERPPQTLTLNHRKPSPLANKPSDKHILPSQPAPTVQNPSLTPAAAQRPNTPFGQLPSQHNSSTSAQQLNPTLAQNSVPIGQIPQPPANQYPQPSKYTKPFPPANPNNSPVTPRDQPHELKTNPLALGRPQLTNPRNISANPREQSPELKTTNPSSGRPQPTNPRDISDNPSESNTHPLTPGRPQHSSPKDNASEEFPEPEKADPLALGNPKPPSSKDTSDENSDDKSPELNASSTPERPQPPNPKDASDENSKENSKEQKSSQESLSNNKPRNPPQVNAEAMEDTLQTPNSKQNDDKLSAEASQESQEKLGAAEETPIETMKDRLQRAEALKDYPNMEDSKETQNGKEPLSETPQDNPQSNLHNGSLNDKADPSDERPSKGEPDVESSLPKEAHVDEGANEKPPPSGEVRQPETEDKSPDEPKEKPADEPPAEKRREESSKDSPISDPPQASPLNEFPARGVNITPSKDFSNENAPNEADMRQSSLPTSVQVPEVDPVTLDPNDPSKMIALTENP
ncbi:hypothetical protein DSO57_1007531 [Entomophthora muscae]|uniref:Uncharacterized protein n=1 Tax=Entomophthora muscae TaxID=34485 RepID=A0ACC2US95_9FUNG|nr:hypothetical protein DSO57_1007531 [Entomophthora muscae]